MKRKEAQMIIGIFNSSADLENAVDQLLSKDFKSADISILMSTARERDRLFQRHTYIAEAMDEIMVVSATLGALIGIGLKDAEAKRYESSISQFGIILAVHVATEVQSETAGEILSACNAHDIAAVSNEQSSTIEKYRYISTLRDSPFAERYKNIF